MGLDQYAYIGDYNKGEVEQEFYWRKHAQLHDFFEKIWRAQGNDGAFNLAVVKLTEKDLFNLFVCVAQKEFETVNDGFFFGLEYQNETSDEYKTYDLDFCRTAAKAIVEDKKDVWYTSWW